jgi:tetratricopeptide (TPR) repeat protein
LYADRDDQAGVFDVDGRLFEFAVERGLNDEALALGQRCLSGAPDDAAPKRVAEHHHLLAATKHHLDRADAMAAYEQAIELADALDGWTIGASYRIEAALLYIDTGQPDAALRHLHEAARSTVQPQLRWLADDTIADLQLSRFHDAAAAVRSADAALERVLHDGMIYDGEALDSTTVRAHSLYRCGIAAYAAGDLESAYRRFTELRSLLDDDLQPAVINVTATYLDPRQGDRGQGKLDMLLAVKNRRDRLAAVAERRHALGLFAGLSGREPTLSYDAVRSLLAP